MQLTRYLRRSRSNSESVSTDAVSVAPTTRPDPVTFCTGRGIEIGAHDLPIAGLTPIYVDQCREYAYKPTLANVLATATFLPFADSSLDYVAASHVIEHMPQTIRALREWHRVVKDGGHIYLIVPDKRRTFDRSRPLTPLEHVLTDDREWSPLRDIPHAVEIAFAVPVEVLEGHSVAPESERECRDAYCRRLVTQLLQGRPVDIHHHVWTPETFLPIVEHLGWEIRAVVEDYPPGRGDGFCVLVRVCK